MSRTYYKKDQVAPDDLNIYYPLQKGGEVPIFQHPFTEEDYEGQAKLIRKLDDASYPGFEIWDVHFLEDDPGDKNIRHVRSEASEDDLRHSTCSKCRVVNRVDVEERYSFGCYAGRLCIGCCSTYRDNCGLDGSQGTQAEIDEPIEEDAGYPVEIDSLELHDYKICGCEDYPCCGH